MPAVFHSHSNPKIQNRLKWNITKTANHRKSFLPVWVPLNVFTNFLVRISYTSIEGPFVRAAKFPSSRHSRAKVISFYYQILVVQINLRKCKNYGCNLLALVWYETWGSDIPFSASSKYRYFTSLLRARIGEAGNGFQRHLLSQPCHSTIIISDYGFIKYFHL